MNVPPGVLKLGRKLKEQAERENRHANALNRPPDEPTAVAMAIAPPAKKNAARAKIDRLKADRELAKLIVEPILTGTTAAPEPILTGTTAAPEPVLTGTTAASEPVVTGAEPPSEPVIESMREHSLREAPRVELVNLCQELVRKHGPLTIDEMIVEIWGIAAVGTDDARWLKAQLCKWLAVAGKETEPKFYPKRHRNPARSESRLHRWGFWAEQQPPDRRYVTNNAEVLAAIAELRAEVASVQATINVLSQWLNGLKDGVAFLHEKLSWSE